MSSYRGHKFPFPRVIISRRYHSAPQPGEAEAISLQVRGRRDELERYHPVLGEKASLSCRSSDTVDSEETWERAAWRT
jgi:hypothetical protein